MKAVTGLKGLTVDGDCQEGALVRSKGGMKGAGSRGWLKPSVTCEARLWFLQNGGWIVKRLVGGSREKVGGLNARGGGQGEKIEL